jgi:Camelysin metallo-endopeptidase
MDQNQNTERRRRRLIVLLFALVAVGSLTLGTMFSGAWFTDQETDQSTFTTGTIDLDGTDIDAMDLTTGAMMPDDTVSGPVTVHNVGTAQLRYAVSQTSTDPDALALRDALNVAVMTEDTGAGSFANDGDYCDDANGTVLHASAAMGASGNLVGNPASGAQAGDRTLNASASEILCFYVSLPSGTGNGYQGATTTTTFTFDAEQTANNP